MEGFAGERTMWELPYLEETLDGDEVHAHAY